MLPSPFEINEKLLRALDKDNNVVDAQAVLEIISTLETYPITRSALEQTRIGRTVNELRKKTEDAQLARRAKQLVRNWKKLIDECSDVNGGPSAAVALTSPSASPALTGIRPRTPLLAGSRVSSPALATGQMRTPARPLISPPSVVAGKPFSNAFRVDSPALPCSPLVNKVTSPALHGIKPYTPTLTSRVASPLFLGERTSVGTPKAKSSSASKPYSTLLPSTSPPSLETLKQVGSSGVSVCQSPILKSTAAAAAAAAAPKQEMHGSKVTTKERLKTAVFSSLAEDSNGSGRLTPSSLHSDNSEDRLLADRDNGFSDSDSQSSCTYSRSKFSNQHNHSSRLHLLNSVDKGSSKDQRDLSKTNVANRKRTRHHDDDSASPSPTLDKKPKITPHSLSVGIQRPEQAPNGLVKSGRKSTVGVDVPHAISTSATPSTPANMLSATPSLEDYQASLPMNLLNRQESSDSRFSDRLGKDKHKVKTTEQLIEELQKKNSGLHVGNSIINKLRTNQIEKEADVQGSVLPPGIRPRSRKKNSGKDDNQHSVLSSADMLSQAKNDMVKKFLETSGPYLRFDDCSLFKEEPNFTISEPQSDSRLPQGSGSTSMVTKSNWEGLTGKDEFKMEEAISQTQHDHESGGKAKVGSVENLQNSGSALSLDEIYAQLPPVDTDSIDWDSVDFYPIPEPTPVTDEVVDRLHASHWSGVNGMYDMNGDWSSWRQMTTLRSYDGDMLHILPYVDLDS